MGDFFRRLAIFLLVVYLFSIIPQQVFAVSGSSLPSKLMVYVGPPKVLADRGVYDSILVQLQDSSGKPARAPQDIVVSLSSSKTDIGSVDPTVTIRSGNTSALTKFFSTYTAGSTTITAVASGYTSGQATMRTYLIDVFTLTVSVTADPTSIKSGEPTTIRVYVTYNNTFSPALGATVKLASDKGGSFSPVTDERNGYYRAVFTALTVDTPTVNTIMVTVSKTGYADGQGQVRVTINPIKVETPQTPPTSPSNPTLTWVAVGILIAGVVIAIVIVKKRLRKPKQPTAWQTIS